MLFGVGLTLGNVWGGKAADRSIDRTPILSLAGLIAVLLVFPLVLDWPLPTALAILVWGAASFALVPPLQMRVMEAAKDAPNLASAVNIGAFNLGNAIGAALGGAVINAGLGYPAISLAGAAMAALGLVLVLLFAWRGRGGELRGRLRCNRPEPWGALRPSTHFLAVLRSTVSAMQVIGRALAESLVIIAHSRQVRVLERRFEPAVDRQADRDVGQGELAAGHIGAGARQLAVEDAHVA